MISRPLTKDERKFLKTYFGSSDWNTIIPNIMFGMAFLTALIYGALNLLMKYIVLPLLDTDSFVDWQFRLSENQISLVVFSLIAALMVSRKMIMSFIHFRNESTQKIRNILRHDKAEIHSLNILRAAELSEWEDEGVGFFLEVDDGRVLFVQGQDLYDYASDAEIEDGEKRDDLPYGKIFPSTHINLVREATIGCRLNLSSDGEALENTPKFDGRSFVKKSRRKSEYIGPQDGELYKGALEDVLRRFSIKD